MSMSKRSKKQQDTLPDPKKVWDRARWEERVTKEQYDYDEENPLIFTVKKLTPYILEYLDTVDYPSTGILETTLLETPFSVVNCEDYVAKKLGVHHYSPIQYGYFTPIQSMAILRRQLRTLMGNALSNWTQYTEDLDKPIPMTKGLSHPSPLLGEYGVLHRDLVRHLTAYFENLRQGTLK